MDAIRIQEPAGSPPSPPRRGLALRTLRVGMGALGAVAPGAAAALAERLWFTPPGRRRSAEAARSLASGRPFAIFPGGRRVAGWSFGDGPLILLMHGWGGEAAQLQPLASALAGRGMRAVVIDAPAHGASGPSRLGARRSSFFDFCDALLEVDSLFGPAVGIAAHSGGAVATYLALRAGLAVRRVVLLAPLVRPALYADRFGEALGLAPPVDAAWRLRAAKRLGFDWEDVEVRRPPRPGTLPALVFHDRGDAEIDWEDGAAVADGWPGARLISTTGLGHRRLLRDPGVLRSAVEFMAGAKERDGGDEARPADAPH